MGHSKPDWEFSWIYSDTRDKPQVNTEFLLGGLPYDADYIKR